MLDEERGTFRGGTRLAYGLAAALLADLAQLNCVRVTPDAVTRIDVACTGYTLLDVHLEDIGRDRARTPDRWIARWGRAALIEHVAERLRVAGILQTREVRAFGLVPVRRHRVIPPRLITDTRAEVHGAIVSDAHAIDATLASVAAILAVLGEDGVLSGRADRTVASERARAAARRDVIAQALRRALARRDELDDITASVAIMSS